MDRREQYLKIHQAVMRAFSKFCKHQKFTERAKNYLKEELPEYTIYVNNGSKDFLNYAELAIWGNGLPYNGAFRISFKSDSSWQENFLSQMDRMDCRDGLEREQDEIVLYPEFQSMEEELIALLDKIKNVRERAISQIKTLPIPESAKTRNNQVFWNDPSSKLREKFPNLFSK